MRRTLFVVPAAALLALAAGCTEVELQVEVADPATLEDAILIASDDGDAPREVVVLGDVDLGVDTHTFGVDLDATSTHYWLIGHVGGAPAYTSAGDQTGVDLYDVEPYEGASPLDWNIAANLAGYVDGTAFSADWWAQVANNHGAHVAPENQASTLYVFDDVGAGLGTVTIDLHK